MTKTLIKLIFICLTVCALTVCLSSCEGEKAPHAEPAQTTDAKSPDVTAEAISSDSSSTATADAESASVPEGAYKYVAFTFDDGPHNEFTKKVVDKLAEYDARATFFVVGDRVNEKTAEIIQYAVEHGNEIGMHSFTHTKMFNACDDTTYEREVKYTKNRLASYAGVSATLLRPPGGLITPERVSESEYPIILWSVDSEDWVYKKTDSDELIAENVGAIVDNVLTDVGEGDIILMHDIYENTYKAFCVIIETLYNEGYRFITVSELLGDSIKSGAKFHSVTLN